MHFAIFVVWSGNIPLAKDAKYAKKFEALRLPLGDLSVLGENMDLEVGDR